MISRTIRCVVAAAVLALGSTMGASAQTCNADLNGDGLVDGQDLAIILASWGACPLVISAVAPLQGLFLGGTEITISGSGLATVTAVTVGGAPCTNVTVVSPRQIRATTPPGQVGPAEIVVTSAGGASSAGSEFLYLDVTTPQWATLIERLPDPAVVEDAVLRAAISATGYAWRVRDTATQIEMVLIPPGTFQMGCSPAMPFDCASEESPVHTVTLTQPFYMGRYEVTQAQWTARMGSNPSRFPNASAEVPASQVPTRPVERLSWNMIQPFLSATGMRLPTEAEWEYAYRAETTTAFHSMPGHPNGTSDAGLLGNIAWFGGNSPDQTRPVGQKAGNGFGLHDMSGNVWEWVNDRFSFNYYAQSPSVNPPGPDSGSSRAARGGCWINQPFSCRSSSRGFANPVDSENNIGFRVVRNP